MVQRDGQLGALEAVLADGLGGVALQGHVINEIDVVEGVGRYQPSRRVAGLVRRVQVRPVIQQ